MLVVHFTYYVLNAFVKVHCCDALRSLGLEIIIKISLLRSNPKIIVNNIFSVELFWCRHCVPLNVQFNAAITKKRWIITLALGVIECGIAVVVLEGLKFCYTLRPWIRVNDRVSGYSSGGFRV